MDIDFINVDILNRLSNRFKMVTHTLVQSPFALIRAVQPITNLDELMKAIRTDVTAAHDPTAVGLDTIYMVPKGKRGRLVCARCYRSGGATLAFNGLYLTILGVSTRFDNFTSLADFSRNWADWGYFPWLDEDNLVEVNIDAYTAADEATYQLVVEEEDAFRA